MNALRLCNTVSQPSNYFPDLREYHFYNVRILSLSVKQEAKLSLG